MSPSRNITAAQPALSSASTMDQSPPQPPPPSVSSLRFQMPHFVLSGTPNVAHGGGAEVLPCMYGQGAHAWSEYDKNWYQHAPPSRYYSLDDLVAASPSSATPSKPFEFTDSPYDHHPEASPSPSPVTHPRDLDREDYFVHPVPQIPGSLPQDLSLAAYSQLHRHPSTAIPPFSLPSLTSLDPTAPLPPIPRNGLPLYSASGFDMLKMLAKVATRPNPKIMLGPVDMTCSFVVADVRRFDSPIVYASPTFTRLTGYTESEILGRNCRFLQSPSGQVTRGEERRFTSPDAVRHLQKCLLQEKECQASLINYRKGGEAFINLVTVIPIAADDLTDEITHCVGFQVDFAEQPNAILQKLRDGSYIVNYSNSDTMSGFADVYGHEVRRTRGVSQEMLDILRSSRPWGHGIEAGAKPVREHERAALHAMLLENTDDFIHVVSLKGAFLYVAPAIHRVLGYDSTDFIGKSISDICHPADVIPLMRELKEASALPPAPPTPPREQPPGPAPLFALPQQQPAAAPPKPVHLLFRAKHRTAGYVWLEARGRLYVEQGKGRKAIVLVGRRTGVPRLRWGALADSGGAWGLVAPSGLVLAGSGALGAGDVVGRSLASVVLPEDARRVMDVLAGAACADRAEVRRVQCRLLAPPPPPPLYARHAEILFYASEREAGAPPLPPRLVFQVRIPPSAAGAPDDDAAAQGPAAALAGGTTRRGRGRPEADVLEDLDTARETSWQYELTRLRFENQRMRDEIAALERLQQQHGGGGGGGGPGAVGLLPPRRHNSASSSGNPAPRHLQPHPHSHPHQHSHHSHQHQHPHSHPLSQPHPHPHPHSHHTSPPIIMPSLPTLSSKRMRSGDPKLSLHPPSS